MATDVQLKQIDKLTRAWLRGPADERAALAGYRMDEGRGQEVVDWIEQYCCLYEGDRAGQQMILKDWQLEVTMRLFGWVHYSDDWGREVRRFRRASIWIPKKNGKSPSLAAWGLYLLCGDGEQGQKVYSVAKDGKQAMISHTHALEMVRRSPELESECSINKSTGQITHEPTRSFYKIVAGDNPNSQEGLNGSVMVDETHVVDRRLMKILRGAGISRSEPMHIEVSTAGCNPDGYGKSQFDYGAKVIAGESKDHEFFYQSYAAAQDLSDEELDRRLLEIGKACNPTWGRIVRKSEFESHYNTAKMSAGELADFKMYRLNIWQNAENPWLKSHDWAKGERQFSAEDLHGRECWAALDLSSVRDMTALCLAFPEPDGFTKLLWWYWLPEETATSIKHLIPIQEWEADERCNLHLTPGGRLDFGYIRSAARDLATRYKINELAYDDWNAEKETQEICEGVRDRDGKVIEPGTGIPRLNFSQGLKTLNYPTKQFEGAVIDGKILHNGDPLSRWHAMNATIKPDPNGNYKPMKPTKDSVKKIDGVIVAIMAHNRASSCEKEESVYEGRGLRFL